MDIKSVRSQQISINKPIQPPKVQEQSQKAVDTISLSSQDLQEKPIKINILHLNDVHGAVEPIADPKVSEDSEVGGIAYSKTVVDAEKSKNPEGTLTVNAGDIAEGTMVAHMTKGKVITEAFNQIGFDAVTLGNHDFEWGQEQLGTIVQDLNSPVVAANIVKTDSGETIDGVKPYVMKNIKGVNIAIIGLGTPDTVRYIDPSKLEGLRFDDAAKTLEKYIPQVKAEGADVVLALSHLGFEADKKLASQVEGIDVIVGGHSHTELPQGHKEGNTIIVQAGSQSRFVGNLELEIDPANKGIKSFNAKLMPVINKDLKPDSKVQGIVNKYLAMADQQGSQIMGTALEDIHHSHKEASKLNQIFADSILEKSGAEIGLCSSRILRGNLTKGDVSYKQLYSALPFTSEEFFTVSTTGKSIIEEIESRIVDGGRGIAVPAGFKYEYDSSLPDGSRLTSVTMPDGSPLDPDKEYNVVLNSSTISRKSFDGAKNKKLTGSCQETFFEYFKQKGPWSNDPDDRVKSQ